MFFKPLFFGLSACAALAAVVFVLSVSYTTTDVGTVLRNALFAFFVGTVLLGLAAATMRRALSICFVLAGLAALALAAPAYAQDASTSSGSGVVLPYGQWISEYLPLVLTLVLPWLTGLVTWAIAKWAPWASSVATQQRVNMAAEALGQYAIKAVPNSVKDGKVTVKLGSTVLATAVQRGVNVLPSRVLKAMEKGGGITSIIFRVLDLEPAASEENVLKPAVAALKANGTIS